MPYGGRPLEEVRGFALNICDFLIERGAKLVVMACNISSAIAINAARERHPNIPIIGVVQPGARAAVATGAERIGVLATQGTVNSGAYEREIRSFDKAIGVLQVACPKFVPLVEDDKTEGDEAFDACYEALEPLSAPSCDAIILGCTHYPFLLPMLERTAGLLFARQPVFVNPAGETVRAVAEALRLNGIGAPNGAIAPAHTYFASGNPDHFRSHAALFLGAPVDVVEKAQ